MANLEVNHTRIRTSQIYIYIEALFSAIDFELNDLSHNGLVYASAALVRFSEGENKGWKHCFWGTITL